MSAGLLWAEYEINQFNQKLFSILETAAKATGVELVIFSGGQDPEGRGTRSTGGTGHDNGFAADVWLYSGPTSG